MKDIQERLLALDTSFGITNVQHRSYLPGRLWISTNEPEMIREALYKCNVYNPGRFWITKDSPKEPLLYGSDVRRRRKWSHKSLSRELLDWKPESLPKAGQWVRATRGLYKGDLAFVLMHSSYTDILQIATVPRRIPDSPSQRRGNQSSGNKRKLPFRPPRPTPFLFDPEVAKTESFMEEQAKVAAAQNKIQEQSKVATTQGRAQTQSDVTVDVAKIINAVETLIRPTPPDGPDLTPKKPYALPNGTPRSRHEGEIPQDTCYRYKGATFIGGLLIKNVRGSDYRLEVFPSKHDMVAFVNSRVWPAIILPQFVALHWKEGDKAYFYAGSRGTVASPGSATTGTQKAIVRPECDGQGNGNVTGECIPIDITDLYRRWTVGDGVKVVAGVNMGKEGLVVQVFDDPPSIDFLDRDSLISVGSSHY